MTRAIGTGDRKFTPAPAGTHQAVCVDVVDLGMIERSYQGHSKTIPAIKFVFQINRLNPENNRRFAVHSARLNNSLDPKASLRKIIEAWDGPLSPEAAKNGFDLDEYIGRNCLLSVVHFEKEGTVYANIGSITPLMDGMELIRPEDYVRVQDREQQVPAESEPGDAVDLDSDIPF